MPRKDLPPRTFVDDQRAALFAAVKESPDDDAPRLVLADWLEEHGDEEDEVHADLIRVQCEILRLSASLIDPESPDTIHRLLRSAGYHVSVLPYHFTPITAQDERILGLQTRQKALIEHFGDRRLNVLPFKHLCGWHQGFAYLNLNYAPFRSREMAAFAATPAGSRVEFLSLDVADSRSARIARCPLLAQAVGLEPRGLQLSQAGLTTLLASPHLASLCRLDLTMRVPRGSNIPELLTARQRDLLTHLYLYSNTLNPDQLQGLASTSLPALEALHLGGNNHMRVAGARSLVQAPFLAHLEELVLTNCQIGDTGLQALATSPHFRCPPLLEIGMTGITSVGLRALLAAPGLERLTILSAGTNALNNEALAALADTPRLQRLLHLGLPDNPAVGPDGVRALAKSPHLRRLASLNLRGCPIGEQGARALLEAPHLRRLHLTINTDPISEATVAGLEQRYFLNK